VSPRAWGPLVCAEQQRRTTRLPYGRHSIDDEDVAAVLDVLRSDWLTTGPKVEEFEVAFAGATGVREAVAVSSGTAALHAAMFAIGLSPGDEVIVPAMTFAATANAVLYQGGRPVFADVEAGTLLLDPAEVERLVTSRTRCVIAVDYAGQPCDYEALGAVARRHALHLVADACHALGGTFQGRPVGSLAELSTFSLHPVKPITSAEGGVITTDDRALASRMRVFRNHGITSDHRQREHEGSWFYQMTELGYNYRLSDLQCALGRSQLRKLPAWTARRRQIAARYDAALIGQPGIEPLAVRPDAGHAYHLYVVRIGSRQGYPDRATVFRELRRRGISANVHYVPVHLHPYYRDRLQTAPGLCPVAEAAYEEVLSLPLFPAMTDQDADDVLTALADASAA
jgi:perosamine synthetase